MKEMILSYKYEGTKQINITFLFFMLSQKFEEQWKHVKNYQD